MNIITYQCHEFCWIKWYLVKETPWTHGLTSIPAWISNHLRSQMWDEIASPFPNITDEVWELISNPALYRGFNYFSMLGLKLTILIKEASYVSCRARHLDNKAKLGLISFFVIDLFPDSGHRVLYQLILISFCEARRASHCHSPQTKYSSKSTCCAISAQNSAMHVVVYAGRLTSQRSIVEIINWYWSYWQI